MTLSAYEKYPTGNLCNAHPDVRALPSYITPLLTGRRIAGRALTVKTEPGQNAAIHKAVHTARPGDLLVVDMSGSERYGPFGDLLAECCLNKGIVGGVFNGTIRDRADIAALGFQVFCRGFHPEGTAKDNVGEVGVKIRISDVDIHPGDIIVGDDDGVVVIPQAVIDLVLSRVDAVAQREETIRARMRDGETTFEIFELG